MAPEAGVDTTVAVVEEEEVTLVVVAAVPAITLPIARS